MLMGLELVQRGGNRLQQVASAGERGRRTVSADRA